MLSTAILLYLKNMNYSWLTVFQRKHARANRHMKRCLTSLITHACVLSHFNHVQHFVTLWTVAHQATLSNGIFQARILEWIAISSSRGSSQTCISYTGRWILYCWATREDLTTWYYALSKTFVKNVILMLRILNIEKKKGIQGNFWKWWGCLLL